MLTRDTADRSRAPAPTPDGAASGAAASSSAAGLDPEALQRLRELDPTGASKLMERVVKAFNSSAAGLVPQLHAAQAAADAAGIRHVAHTLKSSSASIGAVKLSHLCAEMEAMAWGLFSFFNQGLHMNRSGTHRFHEVMDVASNYGVPYAGMAAYPGAAP